MSLGAIKALFLIGGVYDVVLGIGFALLFRPIYNGFGITLPNHDAYIQLPGLLIAIFGIGFFYVSQDPYRNRPIILMGILLKLAFCGVAFGHRLVDSIPALYLVFAACDAIFAVLFVLAYVVLGKPAPAAPLQ